MRGRSLRGGQSWGVNFLELDKGLHCYLESGILGTTDDEDGARGGEHSGPGCAESRGVQPCLSLALGDVHIQVMERAEHW